MRFSAWIMVYFVVGAVMWGGGVIAWNDSGVGTLIIDDPGNGTVNESTGGDLEEASGPIQEVGSNVEGTGLIAVWNIIIPFLGFLFWPVAVLWSVGAPPRVMVLLGGAMTVGFLGALIKLVRSSA